MEHLYRLSRSVEPLPIRFDIAPAVVMAQRALPPAWEPPPIVPSELGEWRSTGVAVISDSPLARVHTSRHGHGDLDYYGGFLICESLPSDPINTAIAGLPRLARAVEAACNSRLYGNRIISGDPFVCELADALVDAFPALLLPHRKPKSEHAHNGQSH